MSVKDKATIARQNRSRGKRVQKNINKNLDAENIGTLGGEDGKNELFSIEAKGLKKFVGEKFMIQAEKNNVRNVTPIVVVHIVGSRYENDLVMIRFKDFEKILEKGENDG